MPYFGETYKSPKMLKAAKIRIEMYDEDAGWMQSNDDLILRWDTVNAITRLISFNQFSTFIRNNFHFQTIDNLLENGIHWSGSGNIWKNKIVSSSTWKDEYPDWELQQFLSTNNGFREVVPVIYYSEE